MHFYVLQARVVNGELKVQAFHNDAHHDTHIAQEGSKKIRQGRPNALDYYTIISLLSQNVPMTLTPFLFSCF